MKRFIVSKLLLFYILAIGCAQKTIPFQMPATNNKQAVYDQIDFYHFSSVAFDSQNRPYGFNIKEEFGYIRTLRNGLWVKRHFLDELQQAHSGKTITNCHTKNTHAQSRISVTSDNHLYATINYLVDGEMCWSILYLDDLDTDEFQVEVIPTATSITVEEFTGYNLLNGETPLLVISEGGKSLKELEWPTPTVSWTINNVSVVKVLIPYRDESGRISFNSTLLGETLGAHTIHSGGCASIATYGNRTYLTFNAFNERKIKEEKSRQNVNWGMLAEIVRPDNSNGVAKIQTRFMAIQSVYGHIDSHSQGSVVIDRNGKLHYVSGNHAANDEYFRTTHSINDPEFSFRAENEWKQYGMTTRKGDFSYDTPVIDGNNTIHFAYRQRNGGKGRGLCVKSALADVTDWGKELGDLIIQPPAPYDRNGEYIVLYHRLVMDRAENIHLSSGFFEFKNGVDGDYPRIGAMKLNGKGEWIIADRYKYSENIIDGKKVQRITCELSSSYSMNDIVKLSAISNFKGASVKYKVLEGPAQIRKNKLSFTGKGKVIISIGNKGNKQFYADKLIKEITIE